jgi:hypothetical protein
VLALAGDVRPMLGDNMRLKDLMRLLALAYSWHLPTGGAGGRIAGAGMGLRIEATMCLLQGFSSCHDRPPVLIRRRLNRRRGRCPGPSLPEQGSRLIIRVMGDNMLNLGRTHPEWPGRHFRA